MKIIISNTLQIIPENEADKSALYTICSTLTVRNPEYDRALKYGRHTGNIPVLLRFYEKLNDGSISVPRGFGVELAEICSQYDIAPRYDDQRLVLPEIDFAFAGTMRPYQERAVNDMLKRLSGVLDGSTGCGKTITGLKLISERRQRTLVLVHTRLLLDQWIDRIEQFLGIPREQIGVVGGGKKRIGEKITVATVQSAQKCIGDLVPVTGCLVLDECHHAPASTFSEILSQFRCQYTIGLTATCFRRDRLNRLISWYVGPTLHKVDENELVDFGAIVTPEVHFRNTNFHTELDPKENYSKVLNAMAEDRRRNEQIVSDTIRIQQDNPGGLTLIVAERVGHCSTLEQMLNDRGTKAISLTGTVSAKKRDEAINGLRTGVHTVVVATASLISEGFDLPDLSNLVIACPVKFPGKLVQMVGRVRRPADGKTRAVVIDYVDSRMGVFRASAASRLKTYREHNFVIHQAAWLREGAQ